MDNKSDNQLTIMQATIDSNRQYYDERIKKLTEYLTEMIASMMDQIKISEYSPDNKDYPKDQYPTTVVPYKAPPFEVKNYTKIGGIWTLKHDIS